MNIKKSHRYGYVYYLRCIGARYPQYIGCTVMDPTSRLAQHLSPSNLTPGSNGSRKKKMWITESLAAGREIELVVLAKLDISICYAVEQAIIRGLHRAGYPILNQTKYETIKGIIQ